MTQDGFQSEVEAITFSVQLVSGHPRQAIEVRLIHRQQRRRQLADKVILLLRLAQHKFTTVLPVIFRLLLTKKVKKTNKLSKEKFCQVISLTSDKNIAYNEFI